MSTNKFILMSTNKFISYLLCNKGIIVNLYKLHFLSSHFSFQSNKRVFYLPTFPPVQPKTHEGKLRLCLVTIFVFYFQKLVFENIKKKQFSFIFEIKNMLVS